MALFVNFSFDGFKKVFSDNNNTVSSIPKQDLTSANNLSQQPVSIENFKPSIDLQLGEKTSALEIQKFIENQTQIPLVPIEEILPPSSPLVPKDLPMLKSISGFSGLDYVGYVIEKERLNKSTGNWVKVDSYKIIGSNASMFKDTRVAYGNVYRYRMRSVVKYTFSIVVSGSSALNSSTNIENFEKEQLQAELDKNESVINNLQLYLNKGLTFTEKGQENYSVDLQSFSLQSDGKTINVFKKQQSEQPVLSVNLQADPKLMQGTMSSVDIRQTINNSLLSNTQKSSQKEYYSQYFMSNPSKEWIYVNVIDSKVPNFPVYLNATPQTKDKKIILSWQLPDDSQRDIVGFRLYRRSNSKQTWNKIFDTTRENNFYVDEDVVLGSKYIYAVSCYDAHEYESFLSLQIQTQLNENFNIDKKEKDSILISYPGAKVSDFLTLIKRNVFDIEPMIAKKRLKIKVRHDFNEDNKTYLIKITNLNTHLTDNVKLSLNNENIGDQIFEK